MAALFLYTPGDDMASTDKRDLMYRVRFQDPTLGELSSDDLAAVMYERHAKAAGRAGREPLPLEDFKRNIGYYEDSYRKYGSEAEDYGREAMAGGAALVGGIANLGGRVMGVRPEDNAVVQAADSAQESWREGLSPGYRYAQSQSGINAEKVGGALSGSVLPIAAGAGLGRALLLPVTSTKLGAGLMARVAAGDAAAATTLSRASMAAGGASEGIVAGSIGANEAYKRVMAMPLDVLAKSPEFHDAFSQTDPSLSYADRITQARMDLADSISAETGLQVGGATAALGPIGGGAALARFIRGEGAGLRGTLAGTAREFGEEAAQSGAETYLTEEQMRRADPSIDPMAGVGESALLGGITGGVMGAVGSQLGRLNRGKYQADTIPGLSDQNDLLATKDKYIGGALDLSDELKFNPNAFGLALFEGRGRPLAPQVDLLSGEESTIPVIPYRRPDIGAPEAGPGADYLLEQQAMEQAAVENRRQELQQILATATDPVQKRQVRIALASLPRPELQYEPVDIPQVQPRPADLQMPAVNLPAAQQTLFGSPEYLDQEGPLPAQDDFQLEVQPAVDNTQRLLPLESQVEGSVQPPVPETQAAFDLRTPEQRVVEAEEKLRAPIQTVAQALENPPEGVAPGRMAAIAEVRKVLGKPITEALPVLEEAMANPRLAPGTRGKLADFVKVVRKQAKAIAAERTALQEEIIQARIAQGVQDAIGGTVDQQPSGSADAPVQNNREVAGVAAEGGQTSSADSGVNRPVGSRQAPAIAPAVDGTKEGTGEGRKTRDFFAGITEGKSGAPTTSAAETKVLNTPPDGKFRKLYMKFTGNFDRHIEASIPGFREVQVKIAKAIADTYSDADVLDIGASEGALAKAISATGDNVRTVSLDPNPGMLRTFETKEQVEGAEYAMAALGSKEQEGETAWEDEGQDIPYYKPDRQFDVVHEAMVFQFISKDRAEQVARVKELMKPDGVALFEEKYTAGKGLTAEQYAAGEAQKDAYKKQFFTEADMKAKADTVLVGMNKNMPSPGEFEDVLGANFKYAVQFWDSGNFRGYAASDDKAKLDALIKSIGDTSSAFSTVETPRVVVAPKVEAPLSFREERAQALAKRAAEGGGQEPLFSLSKKSPLATVFEKLASEDASYRTGTSTSMELGEVIQEVMKDGKNWRATVTNGIATIAVDNLAVATVEFDAAARRSYNLPNNSAVVQILPAFPMEADGNMFGQGQGLGSIYQAIFNWALNTGRTVYPDTALSGVNSLRRSEHMITSMLKFGTSQHVRPHWSQLLELADAAGFKKADRRRTDISHFWGDENAAANEQERAAIFQGNLHNLLLASSLLSHKSFDRLNNWMASTDGKLYEAPARTGAIRFNEITAPKEAIPTEVQRGRGVGPSTALRAVVTRQAILGITPATTGEFATVAGDSVYRYEGGSRIPTAPTRTADTYPGLEKMSPGEGFWERLFYSMSTPVAESIGVEAVQKAVDSVTAKWGDHANVKVVESVSDLPEQVQEQHKRSGAPDSALDGVYLPSSGEIYLVADNLYSADRAQEVLAHEAVGHYAMEQTVHMGNLVPQIQALEKAKAPAVVSAAAWVDANTKGLTPSTRAKEIVAVLAERGEHKRIGVLKRMVAALRSWLREKGFATSWVDKLSENDVMYLLRHGEAYLKDKSGYTHPLLANVPSWRDRTKLSPTAVEEVAEQGSSTAALASVSLKQKARGQKENVSVAEIKAQAFGYTLDQLANSFSKYIPSLPEYYDLHGRRDASMTESLKPAEDLFSDWAAWAATNNEQQGKLGTFAVESTRRNIHADRVYKNEAELLADQPWLKGKKDAFTDYRALHQAWQAMSPEARKWYGNIRDHYSKQWGEVKKEFRRFIERQTEPNSAERTAMMADLDNEFGRIQGPYFPLMRLGEYLVVAEGPGLERVVSAVETPSQQQALAEELRGKGYTNVSTKVASEYNQVTDGVPSKFVDALDKMINSRIDSKVIDKGVGTEIKAFINQLYLHSLPDVTGRKMLINRTGVAGAEQDLLRVFAKSSYQTAFLKSRLQWQSQIRESLDSITEEVREITSPASPRFDKTADGNAMTILVNELRARYELASQPDPTPMLSKVQSFMYMWYLGLAPGYYITNLLQVPMITVPELSRKYSTGKVLAALTRAYAKALPIITSTWWTDTKMFSTSGVVKGAYDFAKATNLSPDEKALLNRGILDGRLDVTLAYDLGNVAMGNSPTWHKISKGVSYMGHTTEVLNRMATALAAYDLSKDQEYTWRVVDNSQFNYASYNKPRFMSPKYGKGLGLVFQFQQYRQRTLYNVTKAFRDSLTKDTTLSPQDKREARRYLAGIVGTHFLFAGLIGMPMAMTFVQAINMMLNLARDDEEPEIDVLLEGRKALADMAENVMSEDAAKATAETIMRGAPRLANVDLSGRVGAGEIFPWAREAGRGKTGKDWFYEQFTTTLGGPFGGFLANAAEAKKKADQGQIGAAIATASPRAMRDMVNGYLMATSGVRTGSGYDTGFEPTQTEMFLKTIGLQPGRLAEFQEARGTIIKQQKEQRSQRTLLKKLWVMAREDGDREEAKDIEERIQVYNRSHPKARLSKADLYKDLRRVQRLQDDPNFFMGIKVTKGERDMAEDTEELFNDE